MSAGPPFRSDTAMRSESISSGTGPQNYLASGNPRQKRAWFDLPTGSGVYTGDEKRVMAFVAACNGIPGPNPGEMDYGSGCELSERLLRLTHGGCVQPPDANERA